jgi:hypothetical protein
MSSFVGKSSTSRPVVRQPLSATQQARATSAHEARSDASREQLNSPRPGDSLPRLYPGGVATTAMCARTHAEQTRMSASGHRAGCLTPKFGVGGHMRYARSPVACSAGLTARRRRIQ